MRNWIAWLLIGLSLCLPVEAALTDLNWDNPTLRPDDLAEVHDLTREMLEGSKTLSPIRRRQVQFLHHFTLGAKAVDLTTSPDRAVRLLRETLAWPAPAGVVLVRSYDRLEDMPEFVRQGFHRDNTQGVTFGCRYIALKRPWNRSSEYPASPFDQRILSHELTHAYMNSSLGSRRHDLPLWFHEAMAAYASGTGNLEHVIDVSLGPTGIQTTSYDNPMDYDTYALVFRYLRHLLGSDRLHTCMRDCLEQVSVNPLLEAAGVRDYSYLLIDARYWESQQQKRRLWIAVVGLLLVMVWFWRRLPNASRPGPEGPIPPASDTDAPLP